MSSWKIFCGDTLTVLRQMPAYSIETCITSPPYWGLRSYLPDGHPDKSLELGLEATPEEYVAKLVEVFREVRRVLRRDGVLFLNLGDSYFTNGVRGSGGKTAKQIINTGSFSDDTRPTRSRYDDPACGSDDKAPQDSTGFDCVYPCLCDACLVALLRSRTERMSQPSELSSCEHDSTIRDTEPQDCVLGVPLSSPPGVPASTTSESYQQLQASRWRCAMCEADLSTVRSSAPCAGRFSDTSDVSSGKPHCMDDTVLPSGELLRHIRCSSESCLFHVPSESSCKVQPQSTTNREWSQLLKPKDLVGIPWRVAFALQSDGWYLRSDIIWCLSGGTKVYARTQKGEMPTTIKDLVRLDPSTVQLWNGERWTQVLGWNESERGDPLEIELRSGERIGCTEGHLWPTQRGNVQANDLVIGDVLDRADLPEPSSPIRPAYINDNVAWLLGLYLAEGSRSGYTIQLAGNQSEAVWRADKLTRAVAPFGGTVRIHEEGRVVVVDCPPLTAIVDQYIHGRNSKTKGLKVRAWRHANDWLTALAHGYLQGDGYWDKDNGRWRLGFTRNDRLADDLRTLCARLGWTLTLKPTTGEGFGKTWPIYRGEIRQGRSGHHNEKERTEVVVVRGSRARKFWDIGVADEPYLFALASGVLTHNSKPNSMPESVKDRPTKAHEYVFLLAKSQKYFYDADAVREEATQPYGLAETSRTQHKQASLLRSLKKSKLGTNCGASSRNCRSVWEIATQAYPEAHFAVFPEKLVEPCILAGCPAGGTVLDPFCGAGTVGVVALRHGRSFVGIELNREYAEMAERRIRGDAPLFNGPSQEEG